MENALASTLFQNELRHYGLSGDSVSLIRYSAGVIVARVRFGDAAAVLKCFEDIASRREIANYGILQSCGVPTIKVLGSGECSILLEDIEASADYRLGTDSDLSDTEVIKAVAKWYRTLHENGREYVARFGAGMYEEWDCVTLENIRAVAQKFGLEGSAGIAAIEGRFALLRQRLDAAPRTLAYNDFYYTNLVVRKDKTEALMFDYNLLGKGCSASDIANVTYWFSEENKKAFFSVYGEPDEELALLDRICAPIVSLCFAMQRDVFPDWAHEAIEELKSIPELIKRLPG